MKGGKLALACGCALLALAVPSAAAAATLIGETFSPSTTDCSSHATQLQSGSLGGQYTVPSAGVITSWSHEASASPPELKLKVARPAGGNNFTMVGDSPVEVPAPSQLNTYTDVRIPVQAGT